MAVRIRTIIISMLIFLPLLYIGGWPFFIFIIVLGLIGLKEFMDMFQVPVRSWRYLITALMMVALILPDRVWSHMPNSVNGFSFFYIGAMLLMFISVYAVQHMNFSKVAEMTFAALYLGVGFHCFYKAREMGLGTILYVLAIIWCNDSFAYMFGKKFGRHKVAPHISPNKTLEGCLAGIFFGVIGGSVIYGAADFGPSFTPLENVIVCVILCLIGQFGDLAESAIKRYFRVKDSGTILPGHGGILDRFDSSLMVMPAFNFLFSIFK